MAEVLITLGIIGVVAALMLPTLLSKVQDKVLENEGKKSATIAANGYKLMSAHYEVFNVSNLPLFSCEDIECVSKEHKRVFNIMEDSVGGLTAEELPSQYEISGAGGSSTFSWRDVPYIFMTVDGYVYGLIPNFEMLSFDLVVDVNGKLNPNIAAKDLRKYRFPGDGVQMYDVSEELTQVSLCSIDNPSGCKTEEECYSINACSGCNSEMKHTVWIGTCIVTSCQCG